MTNKPDGKPASASDDARASDGKDADARREEVVKAADQRIDEQKKAVASSNASSAKEPDDEGKDVDETDLVAEALDHSSDA